MKDLKKFNHTVNVLLKTYLNDTLERSNCYACAVGNIIADANGIKFRKAKDKMSLGRSVGWLGERSIYEEDHLTASMQSCNWMAVIPGQLEVNVDYYYGLRKTLIDNSGYTPEQLAAIERAFEAAPLGINKDEDMFNGLMAVVDVLAEIHEIDLETVKETKQLFV